MGYTTRNAPAVKLGRLVWGWRCPTFTPVMGTIIGAKVFHCPVRNGKEWCHLAMAAKKLFNVSCLSISFFIFSVQTNTPHSFKGFLTTGLIF